MVETGHRQSTDVVVVEGAEETGEQTFDSSDPPGMTGVFLMDTRTRLD